MAARRPLVLVGGKTRQMTVDEFNDLRWQMLPLGIPFPIQTHIAGVPVPPTDNPNYRYIKLTASDSYNDGVLTSESVSGSAPLVQATAVINYASSPMNGETVRLINTERRVIRAGNSGAVEQDAMQNITGTIFQGGDIGLLRPPAYGGNVSGVFKRGAVSRANTASVGVLVGSSDVDFDASLVARTADENRVKSLGADYFMRIR